MTFNYYRIKRDHSNSTGFYIVYVPEACERGYGFQVRVGDYVYGFSFVYTYAIKE